jgi:hypothetical protein
MRILKLFITVLGAILLLWVAIDHEPLLLQIFGRPAEGRVTAKYVKYHTPEESADSGILTLRYEFEIGGVRYSGESTVTRAVYNATETGGTLRVEYLPSKPGINFPEAYAGRGVRGLPLLILGLICFAIGVFLMRKGS